MNRRRFLSFLGVVPLAAVGAVIVAPDIYVEVVRNLGLPYLPKLKLTNDEIASLGFSVDSSPMSAASAALDEFSALANTGPRLSRQEAWRQISAVIESGRPFNKQIVLT